ncbi:MAG: hypothetical protein AB7O66_09000 [Limisphaerales bacterium]
MSRIFRGGRPVWTVMLVCLAGPGSSTDAAVEAEQAPRRFSDPPHSYFERAPTDRFTRMKDDLESGRIPLDRAGGEKAFVVSLLSVLGIPVSSQMLVFSTTSLQLSRITPSNPRALYFNEELYLGYVPGGRLELAALDRDLGAVFYIFDIPRGDAPIRVERATRCMNCHAGEDTGHVPGLLVKSVVPGPSGGSLDSFRRGESGHGIPWEDRFGGWYLTGAGAWTNHWANTVGRSFEGVLTRIPNLLRDKVDLDRYPAATSDLLAQAVHEHQVGFVNRAVALGYRARAFADEDGGLDQLTAEHAASLEMAEEELFRYLLFEDEVALPEGGISGDPAFLEEFRKGGRKVEGRSLRDLNLKTRLFEHRCSFMIHSSAFDGLPRIVKDRILRRLGSLLRGDEEEPREGPGSKIPREERNRIRQVLGGTLSDLPAGW